jgi:hypothetical protein
MSYLVLGDIKAALQLESHQTTNDEQLRRHLTSAVEAVSRHCGRREFIDLADIEPSTRTFDTGGGFRALVDDVHDITMVEESIDNDVWSERTDFWATPLNITPATGVESLRQFARFVRVTGSFGYGSVPSAVVDATIIFTVNLFDRRNSPSGVLAGGDFGPVRISRHTDPTVAELLEPYVRADRTMGLA